MRATIAEVEDRTVCYMKTGTGHRLIDLSNAILVPFLVKLLYFMAIESVQDGVNWTLTPDRLQGVLETIVFYVPIPWS